ncbi:L-threonylcarbamoyladenylate synthase [Nonomuraea aridisoli]|uniref:L-threonylcarbamoyladenylate synthase n=1 Tax=Nonomuraea aridisoli TaxID=2070368 RepID=UPI001C6491D4|nr:Sua5 family C-terminal domain-containing protein [Nonomuraea aridisoli]
MGLVLDTSGTQRAPDDAVDFVLDGGLCQVGVESTIVDATGEIPSVLRPGGVTREDLEAALGRRLAVRLTSRIRVPGQHSSHYAPRARVVLVEPEKVVAEAELAQEVGHQAGVLLPPSFADALVKAHAVVAVPGSMAAYARGLYGSLRELDQRGCNLIVASDWDWRSPTGSAAPRGPSPANDRYRRDRIDGPGGMRRGAVRTVGGASVTTLSRR